MEEILDSIGEISLAQNLEGVADNVGSLPGSVNADGAAYGSQDDVDTLDIAGTTAACWSQDAGAAVGLADMAVGVLR